MSEYRWLAIYDPIHNQPCVFAEDDWDFPCTKEHTPQDHGWPCIDQSRLRALAWQDKETGQYVTLVTLTPEKKPILFRRSIFHDVLNGGGGAPAFVVPVLGFETNGHKTLTAIMPNGCIFITSDPTEIQWP